MKKIVTLLLSLLFIGLTMADAQTKTVTGKVTDISGSSLSGITVVIKGTTSGTITDNNGHFSMQNTSDKSILIFSCIGYLPQEVMVGKQTTINIALKEDILNLETVVVVGYGSAKVKDMTAPIAVVKGSDLSKHATANPVQALQGKVAGVQVTNFGDPGSNPSVRIRGVGSFTNENPLYVVDGMFYDNIAFLNNNDVQDIAILKDASASAIYGVKASNGVVIITTKRGTFNQKSVVTYDGYVGVQTSVNMLKMANTEQYSTMMTERGELTMIQKAKELWGSEIDTDWYKEVLRNAFVQNHGVSVTGGTEKAAYYVGLNYMNQDGIMKAESNYSRFNILTKGDFKPYKWLKVGANVILSKSEKNNVSGAVWERAYYAPPVIPVMDENYDKTYPKKYTDFDRVGLANGVYANPVAAAYYGESTENLIQILPSYYVEIGLIKDKLTFKTTYSQDITLNNSQAYTPEYYVSGAQSNAKSSLNKTSSLWSNYILDNVITYTDNFGKHNLTAILGHSARSDQWKSLSGSGLGVPGSRDEYKYLSQADAESLTASDNGAIDNGLSFFARASYNYAGKYLLSATMRADGTSKYQQKWGYFPSIGAAWVMSEEKFMHAQNIFSYLKLRASYGVLGNNKVAASNGFASITTGLGQSGVFGDVWVPGFRLNENFSYLTWEKVEEVNVGFEAGFFHDKLTADFDFYNRTTKDAVIAVPVPTSVDMVPGNWATINNRGIELTLNWQDHIGKDFSYSIGANMSTLKNEVQKLKYGVPYTLGGSPEMRTITRPGEPMYAYFGYKVIGVYQNQDQINADPIAVKNGLEPGDLIFENLNADEDIDDRDRQVLGSPMPTFTYGINLGLAYKGWDLTLSMMGVAGNEIVNQKRGSRGVAELMNYEAEAVNSRWTAEGSTNRSPSAKGLSKAWNRSTLNSYFVEKGDYFRIQNIQLGYNFNQAKGGPKFRVYVSADRPFTHFQYNGFTPEVSGGFDNQTYPLAATYSFGIRITY